MYLDIGMIPPYRWPKKACGEGDFVFPLPPQFLRCVAFICEPELGSNGLVENVPKGTTFFVRWPDEANPSQKWSYVVTARHCIEEPASHELFLRVNTHTPDAVTGLSYKDIATKKDDWYKHDAACPDIWKRLHRFFPRQVAEHTDAVGYGLVLRRPFCSIRWRKEKFANSGFRLDITVADR